MSYSDNMYREILMDHISSPRNKEKSHENYLESTLKNPSCGDLVTIYVLVESDIVKDITYHVEGCSICCSSVSILSELLIGKSIDECHKIIDEFNKMVIGETFDEELLGESICLRGVYNTPPRIKCATLGHKAFIKAIGVNHEE